MSTTNLVIPTTTDYDYATMYKSPQSIAIHQMWYESRLQTLAVAYQSQAVNTRFGTTHVLVAGPAGAPPLVLVHSMMSDALEWEHLLPFFARSYRTYALDIPGHSARSAPIHISTTNSDYAIWLLEVLNGLQIRKADFVGSSSGCGAIFKLAAFAPSRLNSAVLLSPRMVGPSRSLFSPPQRGIIGLSATLFPTSGLVRRMLRSHTAPNKSLPTTVIEGNIKHFQILMKNVKFPPSFGLLAEAELGKLTVPTLMLIEQLHQTYKLDEFDKRARMNIPRLTLQYVPDTSLSALEERPDYVNEAIAQFLGYIATYFGTGRYTF